MTWIIQDNLTGISIKEETKSRTRQDSLVCTINKHGYLKDKCNANARLIAAAPELLDMLYLALPSVEEADEFNKPTRKLGPKIRALLKKIEGES